MKVVVLKKVVVSDISNGIRFQSDELKFNDVTNIAETGTTDKIYQITNNGSVHEYSQSDYLISIMP